MIWRRGTVLAAVIALMAAGAGAAKAGAAEAPNPCPDVRPPAILLPRLRDAMLANNEAVIVTVGSSSTLGTRSSDVAHSYPAVLQRDLETALPNAHIPVINRGVGGEDVMEELPRLAQDVIGVRPTTVIWQVGANGAMRHEPLETFQRLLTTGVRLLQEARIDVILMDNQRAPLLLSNTEAPQIEQVMANVAKATGVALFARGALMDRWRDDGFPYASFMSDDGVHHNDLGYRCLAGALAGAILEGLKQPVHMPIALDVMARH